jgi:iron complex outermembrane receptor protein
MNTKIMMTPVKWFNLSFSVDNIMNREYFYSYLTPGRTWWLQAGFKY